MTSHTLQSQPLLSVLTVIVGSAGAALAYALNFPAPILIGPAIAVSLISLAGLRMEISMSAREICFILLGLGVGAGFDANATAAILHWPLAFLVLGVTLMVTMLVGGMVLQRGFGFDRPSGILAATPGHLSFVMSLAADMQGNVARIAVVQSIRLLALIVTVPFVVKAMGYEISTTAMSSGPSMQLWHIGALALAGVGLGLIFKRLNLPAPMLLGPMTASMISHASDLTPGSMPVWLMTPAFLMLGSLIGTRFAGMSLAQFRHSLLAGLVTTAVSVASAGFGAVGVSYALDMPIAHVLAAFSPGGLETMMALSATMGASPGFIAACHVMRMLILSALIPIFLKWALHREKLRSA